MPMVADGQAASIAGRLDRQGNGRRQKAYLAHDRIDQVASSFLKHLATYAIGRNLTYSEIGFLQEKGLELKPAGYRMQDMVRFVIKSELFLEKERAADRLVQLV